MALACRHARRRSLATVAGQAQESERLELEAHLSSCARCTEEHGSLSLVRQLRVHPADGISPLGRQKIQTALALAAGNVDAAVPPRRTTWRWGVVAAGLAVAAVFATLSLHQSGYRVLGGDVVASTTLPTGLSTLFSRPISFHAGGGGRISIKDATADLAGDTDITWSAHEHAMTLSRGAVTLDVEHQVGRRFRVHTTRFIVEVVGTRFTVEPASVRTARGVVRVLRLNGALVAELRAGEAWYDDSTRPGVGLRTTFAASAPPQPPIETRPQPAPAPRPTTLAPSPRPSTRRPDAATPSSRVPEALAVNAPPRDPAGPEQGLAQRLERRLIDGRRCLSRGDAITARSLVAPLFRKGRDLAAEARVLFAESFLIEGRYADAVDAYRIVARDFPRTDQAETSLFTIAQLESEHGRLPEARAA